MALEDPGLERRDAFYIEILTRFEKRKIPEALFSNLSKTRKITPLSVGEFQLNFLRVSFDNQTKHL